MWPDSELGDPVGIGLPHPAAFLVEEELSFQAGGPGCAILRGRGFRCEL